VAERFLVAVMRLGPVVLFAANMKRAGAVAVADETTKPQPRPMRFSTGGKLVPKHLVAGMTPEERNALKAWRRKQRNR
jgi:hypothetical protein